MQNFRVRLLMAAIKMVFVVDLFTIIAHKISNLR